MAMREAMQGLADVQAKVSSGTPPGSISILMAAWFVDGRLVC
jgi:hypothetical protein